MNERHLTRLSAPTTGMYKRLPPDSHDSRYCCSFLSPLTRGTFECPECTLCRSSYDISGSIENTIVSFVSCKRRATFLSDTPFAIPDEDPERCAKRKRWLQAGLVLATRGGLTN